MLKDIATDTENNKPDAKQAKCTVVKEMDSHNYRGENMRIP